MRPAPATRPAEGRGGRKAAAPRVRHRLASRKCDIHAWISHRILSGCTPSRTATSSAASSVCQSQRCSASHIVVPRGPHLWRFPVSGTNSSRYPSGRTLAMSPWSRPMPHRPRECGAVMPLGRGEAGCPGHRESHLLTVFRILRRYPLIHIVALAVAALLRWGKRFGQGAEDALSYGYFCPLDKKSVFLSEKWCSGPGPDERCRTPVRRGGTSCGNRRGRHQAHRNREARGPSSRRLDANSQKAPRYGTAARLHIHAYGGRETSTSNRRYKANVRRPRRS